MLIRVLYLVLCLAVGLLPVISPTPKVTGNANHFPGWPSIINGQPVQSLSMSRREKRFIEDFPGQIGRFSDGKREYILRWLDSPTRKLHPARDCLKAVGYQIETLPLKINADKTQWQQFRAIRAGEKLLISERIYDAQGQQWTDVSSWYWAALLQKSQGPWWALTVAENDAR